MADERALLELIANSREAVMAAVKRDGYPHLTNVLYAWDDAERVARVSTTADRVKGRIVRRDTRTSLHVSGGHFWSYAVAECDAEPTDVAATPGDAVCRELLELHTTLMGEQDEEPFFEQMVEARRMVIRLRVRRVYGVLLPAPPR
jgi:PPOX class probable F420-dependent enzyme